MSMYYEDLPPEIKKRVIELRPDKEIRLKSPLMDMFIWDHTPEGHTFWSQINSGNFDIFYKIYPKVEYKNAREIRRVLRINHIPPKFTKEQLEILKINNIDYEI